MRARILLTVSALLLGLVAPAGAHDGEPAACRNIETNPELPEREVCHERVYFHCTSDMKVANVDNTLNSITTWDDHAPEQSVTEGAGCGALDTGFSGATDHNPIYDAPFQGWFDGRIDSLTVRAHVIDAGTARVDDQFVMEMHLQIDGETIVPRDQQIRVTPVASETGLSREIIISVDDVGFAGLDDNFEHQVQLTLYGYVDTNNAAWVWDTTEVPSGIEFNPEKLAGTVL